MTDLLKDRELLKAFRNGEPKALERVYFEHATALELRLRQGLSRGGTRMGGLRDPDVRDVLQEVFIRAFSASSRSRYDGIRPFGTWLQTIARNFLIDRARRRGLPQAEADLLDFVPDDAEGAEETLLDVELQAATALFVDGLDPEHRRFVELRFEQEQSQEDVARAMNLTRRRVRTLEKHVRLGLHAFLSERGLEPVVPSSADSREPDLLSKDARS
ncbi:MAG: sigma-70 family RNA polymerase sigma factor [Nannocystaceae bacterium]|nr:sigma-70 family RNA polymerase sigma factor [Nannocystaceae bacterium]